MTPVANFLAAKMQTFYLITLLGFFFSVQAVENAIIPTASGQIGINPVTDLGPASEYVGAVGTDTAYITTAGSTTKWIGVNTEYLTLETITSPTATVETVQVIAQTATASADGTSPGDISLLLSEALTNALQTSAKGAVAACNAAKIRRRQDDVLTCLINAATKASDDGTIWNMVNAEELQRFVLTVADNAPAALQNAWQLAKTQAARNKLLIFIAAAIIVGGNTDLSPKIKFPQGKVGPTATSATSTCNPTATVDENSPLCTDTACSGKDDKCTQGDYKNCACANVALDIDQSYFDKDYWNQQQVLLASASANPVMTVAPSCFVNTGGLNFVGKPRASPESWCVCTSADKTGIFPTLTTTSPPCAYATMPTNTISIFVSPPTTTGTPTSCRVVSTTYTQGKDTTAFTSCTCNDDKGYQVSTKTVGGSTSLFCPMAATPTPTVVPLELNKPLCSSGNVKFSRDDVFNIVSTLCAGLISKKMTYPQVSWTPQFFSGASFADPNSKTSDPNYRIAVDVGVNQRACKPGAPYAIDFPTLGQDECVNNFMTAVDGCAPFTKPDGQTYWKTGGINYNDCAVWTVSVAQV